MTQPQGSTMVEMKTPQNIRVSPRKRETRASSELKPANEFSKVRVSEDEKTSVALIETKEEKEEEEQEEEEEKIGFERGDLVWARAKSGSWWPGGVVNADMLVYMFEDGSYKYFELDDLVPFERFYAEKSKKEKSRSFVEAVEKAVEEFCRRAGVGLVCGCSEGLESTQKNKMGKFNGGGACSEKQMEKARKGFQPREVVSFVRQLGLHCWSDEERSIDWVKKKGAVLGYRNTVFGKFDSQSSDEAVDQPAEVSPRDDRQHPCQHSMEVLDRSAEVSRPQVVESAKPTFCKPDVSYSVTSREIEGETKVSEEPVRDVKLGFESLNSTVYEQNTAAGMEVVASEAARASICEFELGDLVWGRGESHLWWPGKISDETFAPPAVLRAKTKGQILVALFGDSSYGWFDQETLVHFQSYYAEKSRQTHSKNFVKAVKEAVNEASRESALGLACRCRNQINFRNSIILGYFSVDVDGYESGGVYSAKQIKKARHAFQPAEVLSFVRQSALNPSSTEQRSFGWIKNNAILLAYRKAVFEECDETYDQTFEKQVQPSRSSTRLLNHHAEATAQATIDSSLAVAQLRKSSPAPTEVKLQVKNDPRSKQLRRDNVEFNLPPTLPKESATKRPPGEDVFQTQGQTLSVKPHVPAIKEGIRISSLTRVGTGQSLETSNRKSRVAITRTVGSPVNSSFGMSQDEYAIGFTASQPLNCISTVATTKSHEDGITCIDEEIGILQGRDERTEYDGSSNLMFSCLDESDVLRKTDLHNKTDSFNHSIQGDMDGMVDRERESCSPLECRPGLDEVEGGARRNPSESVGIPGEVIKIGIDGMVKKTESSDCPGQDLIQEVSTNLDKKRKTQDGLISNLDHKKKRLKSAKDRGLVRMSTRSSVGTALVPETDIQLESQGQEGIESSRPLSTDSAAMQTDVRLENIKSDLSQLVHGLIDLAIDPFHGEERNIPKIVRQAFLRYRSIVYQKSLVKPPLNIPRSSELLANRTPANTVVSETPKDSNDRLSSKRLKHQARAVNLTKDGQRLSCDSQEVSAVANRSTTETVVSLDARDVLPSKLMNHQERAEDFTTAGGKPHSDGQEEISALANRSTGDRVGSKTLEKARDVTSSSKLLKHPARTDLTKTGQKRNSDRQDEMSAMKAKKLKALKSMVVEKKAGGQKIPEMQQGVQKDMGRLISAKTDTVKNPEPEVQGGAQKMDMPVLRKPEPVKKSEPLVKLAEPIMLVMMFPSQTVLPSATELEARFARFGPLDLSALRIFVKSSTCRVVFKHKSHGQSAYNYANKNNLFGNVKVNYQLWDLGVRAPEVHGPAKRSGGSNDSAGSLGLKRLNQQVVKQKTITQQPVKQRAISQQPVKQNTVTQEPKRIAQQPKTITQQPLKQPVELESCKLSAAESKSDRPGESSRVKVMVGGNGRTVEPKSCIKKPFAEDAKPNLGVQGESHRVKFMLGERDGSSGGGQVVVSSNSRNSGNRRAEVGASQSPSITLDVNRTSYERASTTYLPHPHHVQAVDTELELRNHHTISNNSNYTSKEVPAVDISHQLLRLLVRCNDIVTTVRDIVGYKPYTPL